MVRTLCTTGNHEALKGGVHGVACVIAGVIAAYNIAACCFRRDHHLKVNAVVYSMLVAYELKQTFHHLGHISSTVSEVAEAPAVSERCA